MSNKVAEAKKVLKDVFGYDSFRPLQENIIDQVLNKRDTLVIMPTGGGKSICYQIPALIFDGLTVVVSPLISLMKDQVEQMRELDVPAVHLNSSLSPEAYGYSVRQVQQGKAKLLYLAPETLMMEKTQKLLEQVDVDCFTIDEAHCISEWGHDFRPEYRQLAEVKKQFPNAVGLALTATATPRVREDIKKTLELKDEQEFIASFDRKNLFMKIADKKDPLNQVLDFLYTRKEQSGIIYCFSRRQVDELTYELEQEGYSVRSYHAGLSDRNRAINQRAFIRDDVNIIVATIAFGMGINKSNVRFVMHYDMPQNIESYYQQIGRAGRDGLRSDCVLLFSYSDINKIKYFINKKEGKEKDIAERHLDALVKFMESRECRRKPLLNYFGEDYEKENCGMCDNCIASGEAVEDLTAQAQKLIKVIQEVNGRWGAGQLINILRGSQAKKVLEEDHDKLESYDSGREFSKAEWEQLVRLMLRQNYIAKGEFSVLQLTEKAQEVIQGIESVYGKLDRTDASIGEDTVKRTSSDIESGHNKELFEVLRAKRKELADERGIPPYNIFPDTTLMEMAFYLPQDKEGMLTLYGVGNAKLKKYGDVFIGAIKNYSKEHGVEEKTKSIRKKVKKQKSSEKHVVIGDSFNEGHSIDRLSEEHGVKEVTILKHLQTYMEDGNQLRLEGIKEASELSTRQQDDVLKAFSELGPELLRPVYTKLDKKIGYGELRIMQLYYMADQD